MQPTSFRGDRRVAAKTSGESNLWALIELALRSPGWPAVPGISCACVRPVTSAGDSTAIFLLHLQRAAVSSSGA